MASGHGRYMSTYLPKTQVLGCQKSPMDRNCAPFFIPDVLAWVFGTSGVPGPGAIAGAAFRGNCAGIDGSGGDDLGYLVHRAQAIQRRRGARKGPYRNQGRCDGGGELHVSGHVRVSEIRLVQTGRLANLLAALRNCFRDGAIYLPRDDRRSTYRPSIRRVRMGLAAATA